MDATTARALVLLFQQNANTYREGWVCGYLHIISSYKITLEVSELCNGFVCMGEW